MKIASYIALLLASIITIAAMVKATGGSVDVGAVGFMIWAISPYFVFGVIAGLFSRSPRWTYLPIGTLFISVLMLACTAFVYLSLNGESSTEALVFVILPLYLHIGALLAFGIAIGASWLLSRKTS